MVRTVVIIYNRICPGRRTLSTISADGGGSNLKYQQLIFSSSLFLVTTLSFLTWKPVKFFCFCFFRRAIVVYCKVFSYSEQAAISMNLVAIVFLSLFMKCSVVFLSLCVFLSPSLFVPYLAFAHVLPALVCQWLDQWSLFLHRLGSEYASCRSVWVGIGDQSEYASCRSVWVGIGDRRVVTCDASDWHNTEFEHSANRSHENIGL